MLRLPPGISSFPISTFPVHSKSFFSQSSPSCIIWRTCLNNYFSWLWINEESIVRYACCGLFWLGCFSFTQLHFISSNPLQPECLLPWSFPCQSAEFVWITFELLYNQMLCICQSDFFSSFFFFFTCVSPWYNRHGLPGVKIQVTSTTVRLTGH